MKRCPACNRVEADDTLAFCRADGTPLVSDSLAAPNDSTSSSEIETSLLPHTTDADFSRSTGATTAFEPQSALPPTRKLASDNRRRAIVLTIIGLMVVTVGLWLYFSRTRAGDTAIDSIAVLPRRAGVGSNAQRPAIRRPASADGHPTVITRDD